MRRFLWLLLLAGWLPLQQAQAQAQDLVIENTTISTTASFEAVNSITVGPNVTISSTGDATFRTRTTSLVPVFTILKGGRLNIIPDEVTVDVEPESPETITDFAVLQNYPNPFRETTRVDYVLPRAEHVEIGIYNIIGQKVKTFVAEHWAVGRYSVVWDGTDNTGVRVTSGVYYLKVRAGERTLTKTLTLIE